MTLFTWLRNVLKAFATATPESEAARGAADAASFLSSGPTRSEIEKYWSAACADADMDPTASGRAYANGAKSALREAVEVLR